MMACRYANIEKYLHGIAFKGGSHMPCGQGLLARFAMWPLASSKRAVDRNCVSSNSWNRCFLEDVHRDEWQLVNGLTEFRGPCFVLHWSRFR